MAELSPAQCYVDDFRGLADRLFKWSRVRTKPPGVLRPRRSEIPLAPVPRHRAHSAESCSARQGESCGSQRSSSASAARNPDKILLCKYSGDAQMSITDAVPAHLKSKASAAALVTDFVKVQDPRLRAVFVNSVRKGCLCVRLHGLIEAVAPEASCNAAIAAIRDEWTRGTFKMFDGVNEVSFTDVFGTNASDVEVVLASKLVKKVRAFPSCTCLVWPLLRGILRCFRVECLRPSFDLLLETCRAAFGLKCDINDLITAVALAPKNTFCVNVAPWPPLGGDRNNSERVRLASGLILLAQEDGEGSYGMVFPPYNASIQDVVETEFLQRTGAAEQAAEIRSMLLEAQDKREHYHRRQPLPLLLSLLAASRLHSDETLPTSSPTCGALLWFCEKHFVVAGQEHARRQLETSNLRRVGSPDRRGAMVTPWTPTQAIMPVAQAKSSSNAVMPVAPSPVQPCQACPEAVRSTSMPPSSNQQVRPPVQPQPVRPPAAQPFEARRPSGPGAAAVPCEWPDAKREPERPIPPFMRQELAASVTTSLIALPSTQHLLIPTQNNLRTISAPSLGAIDAEAGSDEAEELDPMAAFISCFYDDMRKGKAVFLSQVNNLYKMRSGGREIKYRERGYLNLSEFLSEIPGVQIEGRGNQMAVSVQNEEEVAEFASKVMQALSDRIEELQSRGADTSGLQVNFVQPQPVPQRILQRIWDVFSEAGEELTVSAFLALYRGRSNCEKLRFRALGHQGIRGLLAQVQFIEKVGGRTRPRYKLKEDAVPPSGIAATTSVNFAGRSMSSSVGAAARFAQSRSSSMAGVSRGHFSDDECWGGDPPRTSL